MHLSKVLMDGGSILNILYIDTLEAMGIPRSCLRASLFPFYGILPGMKAYPVGNLNLPVMFGSRANYLTKTLTFEVVDWKGAYHAILGCPAYAKFMATQKLLYAIIMVAKKLQHYFTEHEVSVVTSFPLDEVVRNRDAVGRIPSRQSS
ncbi:uncharacterized protein LOC120666993 [Panicum virgatum]|uniref:uncharacterized protein LOC120666993 n=1 Tax=Panicum virgatum TaxID=38727 RepID=UPI0019D54C1F|nr:uncharacterized protein LOC120666993 [Panicum virgatum]